MAPLAQHEAFHLVYTLMVPVTRENGLCVEERQIVRAHRANLAVN